MASRSLNVVISADARGFRAAVRRVEQDTDRLDRRMSKFNDNAGGLSLRIGAIGGSIGTLAPAIAALTPAVVGLGGSLAAAAGGAAALGAGLGASLAPILVVGKQVTSRFGEIKKAYELLQTAQRDGTAASKKNADEAMAGLSKSEQAMAHALGRLSGLQQKVLGGASDRIFTALTKAIPTVATMLEGLVKPFNRLGDAIARSIGTLAKTLSGPAWSNAFKAFIDSASGLIAPMTTIFTSIANIIRDVALAALPMVQDAIKGIADWFNELDRSATRSKIREIVGGLVDQTKSWFGLFRELGGLVARVFGSAAGKGQGLVDTLTNVVRAVNHFIDGMKSGEGAGGEFASGVSAAFQAAKTFIGNAVRAIRGFLTKHRQDIHDVIEAFKRVASFARTTWQETLLPIIKRTAAAIKPIVEGIADVIRGVVRVISGLLSGNWDKAWSGAKEAVSGAWKVIKTVVKTGIGDLWELIRDLGPKLVKLIVKGIANLGKALATGIFEGVKAAAKAVPGLVGGVLKGIGKTILNGMTGGLGGKIASLVGDGIGRMASSLPSGGGGSGGSLKGAQPALAPFAAIGSRFGLHVSSGRRPGAITSSGNVSYHSSGEAIDETGTPAGMMGFFQYLKGHFGGRLAELIYGPGRVGIKNGQPYNFGPALNAQHMDHVHVAFDTGRPGVGDGPGKAGGGTYDPPGRLFNITQRIWKKQASLMGVPVSPLPKLNVTDRKSGYAVTYPLDREVDFARTVPRLLNVSPSDAITLIVHELSHIGQRDGMSHQDVEGGATWYSRLMAPALAKVVGLASTGISSIVDYPGFLSGAKKHHKESWALHGQFHKPGEKPSRKPRGALGFNAVAKLAESVGLPGVTFAQIAHGESSYNPRAIGHDPGGTTGYGLWQITSGFNDDIIRKYGGPAALLNAHTNALAARDIWRRQGKAAWDGTRYVTAWNLHYKGGGSSGSGGSKGSKPSGPKTGRGGSSVTLHQPKPGSSPFPHILDPQNPADVFYAKQHGIPIAPTKGVARDLNSSGGGDGAGGGGDTGDPNQPLIDALAAEAEAAKNLADQLAGVKASIDAQTAFASGVSNTSNYQLTKTLADLISGHIVGYGVAGRAFTPGTGTEHAY